MGTEFYWPRIVLHAKAHGIDPYLLAAIVEVESAGDFLAVRYEPAYKWLSFPEDHAHANRTTVETEIQLQKFSFGLCQLMGGVLRELGHRDPLPQVFDPEINLEYGSKKLARLTAKYPVLRDAISSYNAGSPRKLRGKYRNQGYVDRVEAAMTKLKGRLTIG